LPLTHYHTIADLREKARRRLPSPVFDFLDGAAESERTARRNTAAFDDVGLVPHCLADVSNVDTATTLFGQRVAWPVVCAPTGASRLFHPDGEIGVARAASAAGMFYTLSTGATFSIEEVAATSCGPKMFQLYVHRNRDITWMLLDRAKQAGYSALCLTVDVPVVGKRERDLRSGFRMPPALTVRSLVSFVAHPRWAWDHLCKQPLAMANFAEHFGGRGFVAESQGLGDELDASVSWKDIRQIIEYWDGPFALKGVMSPEDARRAADMGVTALVISNHGGRQLDGAIASIEALPAIAQAVGDQMELVVDGGIRRGAHILKALALGAKACMIGRPYLYGLSAAGEPGVARAFDILKSELVVAMQLSGCPEIGAIDRSLVRLGA